MAAVPTNFDSSATSLPAAPAMFNSRGTAATGLHHRSKRFISQHRTRFERCGLRGRSRKTFGDGSRFELRRRISFARIARRSSCAVADAEEQQVEAESYALGAGGARPIRRAQDVFGVLSAQFRDGRCAIALDELEVAENLDRAGNAVASPSAQFDQIVWRCDGDEKVCAIAEHAAEFGGVHSAGD